jgi:hypothetical protein
MRVINFKGSTGLILVSKEEVQFFGASIFGECLTF